MTKQKSLKRRTRARMATTGERYTTARSRLLARSAPDPEPAPGDGVAAPTPAPVSTFRGNRAGSDAAIIERTGRPWSDWFALLRGWGAGDRPHPEIARWLVDEHGVEGWWAQELTVRYELAIGRRRPGERPDGFAVSASRTIDVPVDVLCAAFVDETERVRWLPPGSLRLRTATPPRTARFDWEDGSQRLAIGFTAKGDARSSVALEHSRLPDADAAEAARAFWREHLDALRGLLEG